MPPEESLHAPAEPVDSPKQANRAALVVRPKEPYADWANAIGAEEVSCDLAEHRAEGTVYLVPDIYSDDQIHRSCTWHQKR